MAELMMMSEPEQEGSKNRLLLLMAALVGAFLIALILAALFWFKRPAKASEEPTRGKANAPLTIEEFSDFRCGYCGVFALDIAPQLEKEYIETGKVRLVFRNFPVLGPTSELAAQAGECAQEQGKFWPYHDKVFSEVRARQGQQFGAAELKAWAKDLGLDGPKFEGCLDSSSSAPQVQKDLEAGRKLGIRGTPTFFIGGEKLEGVLPYPQFKAKIEEALKLKK